MNQYTVEQIKAMSVGRDHRFGSGATTLAIKTKKRCWEIKPGKWIHTVLLSDETGDILADVNIGPYSPLTSPDITLVVAWIKDSDYLNKPIKMLYIDQFRINKQTEPDFDADWKAPDWDAINRGKVRHGVVCAFIRAGKDINKLTVDKLVEYIMTGVHEPLTVEEKKRRETIVKETGENDPNRK